MKKPEVNIVVLSYNALKYTKLTIQGIFDTVKIPYYLTIVDNGSERKARLYLSGLKSQGNYCKSIICCLNDSNIGAPMALNQAFEISRTLKVKYICKCDNDLYFWDSWLEKLVGTLESDGSIGAVGPLRISQYTKHYVDSRDSKEFFDQMSIPQPKEELRAFFKTNDLAVGVKKFIKVNGGGIKYFKKIPASMPGHCILIRSELLKKIGFLADPRYEKYGTDDIDLCWEILKKNSCLAINKDVYVHHFRHKSLPNDESRQEILKNNNAKFLKKWSHEIDQLRGLKNFEQNFTDETIEEYAILRHINKIWRVF